MKTNLPMIARLKVGWRACLNGRSGPVWALLFIFAALLPVVAAGECKSSPLSRNSAAELFAKGNETYTEAKRLASEGKGEAAKSKFGEAEVTYGRILQGGFVNWQVLYNLGNALYQQGALGKAIACYRRAQRLAPRQEDVQINLEKAKAEARDKEALPGVSIYVRTLLFPYFLLSVDEVTVAGTIAYMIFGLLLVLALLFRTGWIKALCAITLAVTVVLGATLAAKVLCEQRAAPGVVLSEACAVRFGPGPEYEKRFEAHEGAEFVILARHTDPKTRQEWLKVRLFIEWRPATPASAGTEETSSRAEGWLEAKEVELL